MNKQVEQIKTEIKRWKKELRLSTSCEVKYRREMLDDISEFIDSLPEEPVENCDERNQRVPPCGKCTHLLETKISDVCSTLECDLPNGNRKASRDVGGCEHFTPKQKGEAG